jgi:lysyl-tRNA synthetase class 2
LSLRQAIIDACGVDFEAYPDAISLAAKMREIGMAAEPARGRGKLIDDMVSEHVEPKLIQPTFLYDYPIDMSPLAKKKPGSDTIVERFEGFIGGMEIANAYSELNDPLDQRERFEKQLAERGAGSEEAAEVADEDFLLAMEYGMPPTGGLGVGIDRLVMLMCNQQSIREVILFPHLKAKMQP